MTPDQLWPDASDPVRRLIRELAESMLARSGDVIDDLTAASLQDPKYRAIADDPVLADADAQMVVSHLKHWLTSNIAEPGRRVSPATGSVMRTYARDVVLRGLTTDDVLGWRSAQRVAWNWWLAACFKTTDNADQLRELIEISGNSLTTFVDDSIAELAEHIRRVREEFAGGSQLQRYATVELLLQGADIAPSRAEAQLGYALTGSHVGAVVWVDSEQDVGLLERCSEQVMRACGAHRRLTVVAGTTALWLWIPAKTTPTVDALAEHLGRRRGVRVALGRTAPGVSGFRRTHMDAAAAQRLLARLESELSIVRYEDVHLVDLLSTDLSSADQFVTDVLGEFKDASPALHQTVLTYVDEGLNRTSTAERLYTHRNTIDRRLARVDELLPKPFARNPIEVTAALTLLRVRAGQ
ncbi:PucR family transcriptional regulator [Mycolicibacterium brisbanense]|uniref:CdaR family transcriptional regulator n=1 Tax=Mycolicibacterium brisbanense TaxID=146020 RepID=A0A117I6I6_9MYCO|nr:helix-turn-helix domain-containing protein [Mycolicibacterium brisbanense]MCV7157514.1 helix-turn-helix domain-containing protein [Mycolicibacterium brisbanense]GAS90153.1 CdaR family transcriptional regulator [Mycolicibacterium brisbanense]